MSYVPFPPFLFPSVPLVPLPLVDIVGVVVFVPVVVEAEDEAAVEAALEVVFGETVEKFLG